MGLPNPLSLISPIVGLAGSSKGGGGAFTSPFFNAGPGGVSPEQAALAQYTLGQNLLRDRTAFANTGTGASTMATEEAGGARTGEAESLAQMSNRNQQAAAQIATQDFQQQQALAKLVQQAQQQSGFGAGLGSFGTGTGSFGTSTSGTGGTGGTGGFATA